MKATRIRARKFLRLKDFEIELPEKISVFVGPNGAGKSSILDTIRTALIGTCRSIARGESGALLTTWGEKGSFVIDLDVSHDEGDGKLHRTPTTLAAVDGLGVRTTITQETIAQIFASAKTLDAVFDLWRAVAMGPSERKALIFDLSGIEISDDWLRENGILEPEFRKEILLSGFAKVERLAAEKRRGAARAIEEGAPTPPEDPVLSAGIRASEVDDALLEQAKKDLDALRVEYQKIERSIGAASASANVLSRLADLEKKKELRDPKAIASEQIAKAKLLEETRAVLAETEKGIEKLCDEKGSVETKYETSRIALNRMKKAEARHVCPDCGLEHVGNVDASKIDKLEKEVAALLRRSTEISEALGQGKEFRGSTLEEIRSLEAEERDLRHEETRALEIRSEIEKLRTSSPKEEGVDPVALDKKLGEVCDRIETGTKLVSAVERYREEVERAKASDRIGKLEAVVERMGIVEKLCRPDGLPALLLSALHGGAQERLLTISALLFSEDEEIAAVGIDEEFVPFVIDRNGEERPVSTVNESVRWRVGFALSDALAQVSGLRFLALDEVSLLDATHRALLFDALVKVRADYDQILLVAVSGPEKPDPLPSEYDARIYYVEGGRAEPIGG